MCNLKIIAVIGDVMLVYKREIGKLLYLCYSICKLSWKAIFTFCVLVISQKKKKKQNMSLYDKRRIQSVKQYG